ncbi:MAG TPA: response regulator [Candidatus Limiplasma sp.]|nr:response regulator [Candidatus Limiplasma sp.]
MIRVLIAEDEPPILRRTKRLIEHIDPDFCVAATAGDGEEALEKLKTEYFDVLFTDIRMPVMDGLRLMDTVQTLYPDCSIVVLSGYQDFDYVASAIRAQAVDYLLKPLTEETLEKLLFKLKEKFIARKQERMQQSIAARINHMFPAQKADRLQAVQLGICLFCAGAMPHSADGELYSHASDIWQKLSLVGLAKEIGGDRMPFVQEYMGDTPAERILVYQPEETAPADMMQMLYQRVQAQSALPINCACLCDTAIVPDIGWLHKRLRRLLADRIIIGKSLYESISVQALANMEFTDNDFAADSETAKHYAELIIGGDPENSQAFRHDLFTRFEQESWTQRRVLTLFLRVITLLESRSQDPGHVFQYREWFHQAVSQASSLQELEEIVQSLDTSSIAISEGNTTIQKVEEYLRSHYTEHITGQTLSKMFGYVPSYISFLFRQAYGQSPTDYLTRIRLDKAKALMRSNPTLLVREVAEQVGFKNQYHFSRVFKKVEGLWPTDFKG